jgi:hypothetical protein
MLNIAVFHCRIKKGHQQAPFFRLAKQGLFFAATIFILKFTNATSGIKYLLLTSIEWVTLRTHFDIEIMADGGTCFECIATCAAYLHGFVFGMGIFLHCLVTLPVSVFCLVAKKGREY